MAFLDFLKTRSNKPTIGPQLIFNYLSRTYPASRNPTYLSIVSGIAGTISTLELGLYQKTKAGRYKSYSHPLCNVIDNPNTEDTISQFLSRMTISYLASGNVYLYKTYGTDGNVNSLTCLDPFKMRIVRSGIAPFVKIFTYAGQEFNDKQIHHIYNPQFYDGTWGHGALEYCLDIINLDSSLIVYIEDYFANSLGKRIGIELPRDFTEGLDSEDKKKGFEIWLKELTTNSGRAFTLPPESKIHEINQTSNSESDIKSLKERSEREICKLFNYPYFKLSGDYGNNLATQSIVYYQTCILPITDIFVENLNKLLLPKDYSFMSFDFDYKNLLMPDTATLSTIVINQVRGSIITPNEGRNILGFDRDNDPESDKLQKMANLIPLDSIPPQVLPKTTIKE